VLTCRNTYAILSSGNSNNSTATANKSPDGLTGIYRPALNEADRAAQEYSRRALKGAFFMDLAAHYLQGRNRTGSDAKGKIYHALPVGASYTFGAALCGKRPGRLSGGWMEPQAVQAITCPACLRKLEKLNA
jgi:hypothetical protein